jgi:hypothetical protein
LGKILTEEIFPNFMSKFLTVWNFKYQNRRVIAHIKTHKTSYLSRKLDSPIKNYDWLCWRKVDPFCHEIKAILSLEKLQMNFQEFATKMGQKNFLYLGRQELQVRSCMQFPWEKYVSKFVNELFECMKLRWYYAKGLKKNYEIMLTSF